MASMIPMAVQAAGANNNTGGIGALNSPWGGSGMDLNSAGRLLDPAGISGNGGLNKASIEAFLDPAGIDSGPYGLNLFGQRQNPNASNPSGAPTVLPTLPGVGAPQQYNPNSFSGYANLGPGAFNKMASQMAGKMYQPTPMQNVSSGKGLVPISPGVSTGAGAGSGFPISMPLIAPSIGTLKQAK